MLRLRRHSRSARARRGPEGRRGRDLMGIASPPAADARSRQRVRLTVQGTVQGVGFRPFVYRTARELGIGGSVANTTAGVSIEAEGPPDAIARFVGAIREGPPPPARVAAVEIEALAPVGDAGFEIGPSAEAGDRAAPRSFPICRPARNASASCSIRAIAATATPSPTARIAVRATASSRICPTTARARRCVAFRCARPAGRSTRTRPTAASTPSRTPARLAGRSSRCGTAREGPRRGRRGADRGRRGDPRRAPSSP